MTELGEIDLSVVEYLVRDKFRLEYVRIISKEPKVSESSEKICNFKAVENMMCKEVLHQNNTVSKKVLHELYDGGNRMDCRYRDKM